MPKRRWNIAVYTLSSALAFSFAASFALYAQAPHVLTPADQQKVESILKRMTPEQKLDYIGGTGFAVRAIPELKLPALEMSDGPFGTRSNAGFPSTTYTAGIGLAASWDRDLAARVGGGIGRDARARGVDFMLGPGVNIYRDPRNSRNFEYFGEDPFLAGQIATGYIVGMQKEGVSATVKHFIGNNSEYLRHDSDSIIDERALREIYLPAFEAAVKVAHVGAVMDSYNLINGQHATQSGIYNIDLLRKEWGFPGVLMSDWDATYDGLAAATGGLDLEMPTGKFMNRTTLAPALASGALAQSVIDEKVRHILSTAQSFGWLDREQSDPSISYVDARNKAAALDSARESAVLLKNTGALLPLKRAQIKTILVVGPDAYPGLPVGGGSAAVVPFRAVSPLEGLSEALGSSANVLYDPGIPSMRELATRTQFMTAAQGGKPGLTLETFRTEELSGAPATTSVVAHIATEGFGRQSLEDNPEVTAAIDVATLHSFRRFTAYFNAPTAARYILALQGAGERSRNRAYVDGKLIFDNWEIVRAYEPQTTLQLPAGPHKIVVEDGQVRRSGGRLYFGIVAEDQVVNARARQLASKADVVLVAAGYQHASESEGGDRTFALPFGQDALITTMAAANPKTIVTVTSGGNVDSTAWIDRVPALLETWYAGQEGGKALAEILLGDVNPSGHLPISMERKSEDNPSSKFYYPEAKSNRVLYKDGIFVGYRGYEHNGVKPLFPFGFGLSYTTFQFSNLTLAPAAAGAPFGLNASFDVTNTGPVKGAEVAQLYVTNPDTKVPHPAHELKGFERVELAPGETKHVTLPLDARAFAYYDVTGKHWTVTPGSFGISVGDSLESLPLHTQVAIPNVPVD